MITTIELAEMVHQMRQAQTMYFKGRTQTVLQEAKTLESQVDKAVKEVLLPAAEQSRQEKLF